MDPSLHSSDGSWKLPLQLDWRADVRLSHWMHDSEGAQYHYLLIWEVLIAQREALVLAVRLRHCSGDGRQAWQHLMAHSEK